MMVILNARANSSVIILYYSRALYSSRLYNIGFHVYPANGRVDSQSSQNSLRTYNTITKEYSTNAYGFFYNVHGLVLWTPQNDLVYDHPSSHYAGAHDSGDEGHSDGVGVGQLRTAAAAAAATTGDVVITLNTSL
jgi:hypothetical protein